jgi:UDPglucose--hexose-1-phosphate uridylyltransferase
MSEMRWHPLLREWVVTATHRQDRTFHPPPGYCPLCPTAEGGFPTEVPRDDYEFVVFDNKFPSLQKNPGPAEILGNDLMPVRPSLGACEVVLFSPHHSGTLTDLSVDKMGQLIQVWRDRYVELGARPEIEYVFIFENKGEVIGVTIPHPHGQIYAFSFIPPRIGKELESEMEYFRKTGGCLHCELVRQELECGERLVAETDEFVAFIPFYARLPYEVHVYAKKHTPSMAEFSEKQELDLARMLKGVLEKFDGLWNFSLPYMMVMHQKPTDGKNWPGSHYHIEFYPPYRTPVKLKYLAGCETGAGTYVNDTLPEEKAKELKAVQTTVGV